MRQIGWSGAILLNSPVGCELRRDRSVGKRDGLCGGPCRPKAQRKMAILLAQVYLIVISSEVSVANEVEKSLPYYIQEKPFASQNLFP